MPGTQHDSCALLVIDAQQSFLHTRYLQAERLPAWERQQGALIAAARRRGWPVVFVFHNEPDGVFSPDSGLVCAMSFLDQRDTDPVFHKHVHNALTESGLDGWLREQGIGRLVISGIRTEQCCETTARVASDLGYAVEFVLDATLTFDMTHPLDGTRVDAAAIRAHTALVLAGRFATITHTADYTTDYAADDTP